MKAAGITGPHPTRKGLQHGSGVGGIGSGVLLNLVQRSARTWPSSAGPLFMVLMPAVRRKITSRKGCGSRMAGQLPEAEAYEKILSANLQRAIDFVKFAETKNAALLALSSAWVLAAINLESSGKAIPGLLAVSVVLTLFLSLCAAIIGMLSFIPRLHLPGFLGGKKAGPHPRNLLYFGDISGLTINTRRPNFTSVIFQTAEPPQTSTFMILSCRSA
jgi:hypothetical protein